MAYLYEINELLTSNIIFSINYGKFSEKSKVSKVIKFNATNTDPFALFWISKKNINRFLEITTGIAIVPTDAPNNLRFDGILIKCDNPRYAFSLILNKFFNNSTLPFQQSTSSIKSNIPNSSIIGHGTIIEDNVIIGNNVIIGYNNVILSGTVIFDNVKIGSNNTIGSIGFGYEKNDKGEYFQINHIGNVVIEEFVEIGNNNCIDRAVLGSTVLKKNCKLDNLIHIAHGAIIGENSLIIANSVIAGSSIIGKNSWIAPSTSIINGISIGENSMTGIGTVVIKDIDENSLVVGVPSKFIKKIQ